MLAEGQLDRLPEPSGAAADQIYVETVTKLAQGLAQTLESYMNAEPGPKSLAYGAWLASR